jgi:hypothetical protein
MDALAGSLAGASVSAGEGPHVSVRAALSGHEANIEQKFEQHLADCPALAAGARCATRRKRKT